MRASREVLRTAALVSIVLGALFGPGYYLFNAHFNGSLTGTVDMTGRADRWKFADGTIQRFPGRLAHTPVHLQLDPERNQAIVAITFEMAQGSQAATQDNLYLATLLDQDQPAWQREIRVHAGPGGTQQVVFPPYVVRTPATHLFLLEELNRAPRPVASVTLALREHAEPYLLGLVRMGIGLLIAGVLLLGYDKFTAQRQ